jgi:hypothetical protein
MPPASFAMRGGWHHIPRFSSNSKISFANHSVRDSRRGMTGPGFLDAASRKARAGLIREGSAPHRLARWANGLLQSDDGMSRFAVGHVQFIDADHRADQVRALPKRQHQRPEGNQP